MDSAFFTPVRGHPERMSQVRGGEGVSQKGTKGDRGRGGVQAKGTSFSLILIHLNKKETNALDIIKPVVKKNMTIRKVPLRTLFFKLAKSHPNR